MVTTDTNGGGSVQAVRHVSVPTTGSVAVASTAAMGGKAGTTKGNGSASGGIFEALLELGGDDDDTASLPNEEDDDDDDDDGDGDEQKENENGVISATNGRGQAEEQKTAAQHGEKTTAVLGGFDGDDSVIKKLPIATIEDVRIEEDLKRLYYSRAEALALKDGNKHLPDGLTSTFLEV